MMTTEEQLDQFLASRRLFVIGKKGSFHAFPKGLKKTHSEVCKHTDLTDLVRGFLLDGNIYLYTGAHEPLSARHVKLARPLYPVIAAFGAAETGFVYSGFVKGPAGALWTPRVTLGPVAALVTNVLKYPEG